MRRSFVAACAVCAALAWARPAQALLCYADAKTDGTGKAMRWAVMPIPYWINSSKVTDPTQKAAFIKAVQAAFTAYEAVTCTILKFDFKGESASVASVSGAILVVFADGPAGSAYFYGAQVKTFDPPDIVEALIQMNVKDYTYTVGKEVKKIDVQTAVTQMIAGAVGFYAGNDPAGGSFSEIKYDYVNIALSKDQTDGVQYTYPKTGAGCTPPTVTPLACKKTQPPVGDGGKAGDGTKPPAGDGTKPPTGDGTKPPVGDGNKPKLDTGGKPTGDGGTKYEAGVLPPKDGGGGCCRISYAESNVSHLYLALLGALIFLGLRRRRRRR